MDIAECYQLLEIDATDSLNEVKQAYRDIVFVWHPDRMAGNLRIQEKAENKIKKINVAYEQLQAYLAHEICILMRIQIYPRQITLNSGEQYTFSVIGFDQNDNEVELEYVSWSVSGGGIIYGEGSFFADYESGNFTVVATSKGFSDTATILIRQPVHLLIDNYDEHETSYTSFEDKQFEFKEVASEEEEPEPDIGFPWKRIVFWGFLTPALFISSPQDPDFGSLSQVGALLLLMWVAGLIKPKAVFKFGLPNTRGSVTQIYFCVSMLLASLEQGDLTVWSSLGSWFFLLWVVGIVNPRATINLGLESRGEITVLYILFGLVLGGIWGGFKGLSFIFGSI